MNIAGPVFGCWTWDRSQLRHLYNDRSLSIWILCPDGPMAGATEILRIFMCPGAQQHGQIWELLWIMTSSHTKPSFTLFSILPINIHLLVMRRKCNHAVAETIEGGGKEKKEEGKKLVVPLSTHSVLLIGPCNSYSLGAACSHSLSFFLNQFGGGKLPCILLPLFFSCLMSPAFTALWVLKKFLITLSHFMIYLKALWIPENMF